jgi:hypothetical protein
MVVEKKQVTQFSILFNTIEIPPTHTQTSGSQGHLRFDQGYKNLHYRKASLFKKWDCGECVCMGKTVTSS